MIAGRSLNFSPELETIATMLEMFDTQPQDPLSTGSQSTPRPIAPAGKIASLLIVGLAFVGWTLLQPPATDAQSRRSRPTPRKAELVLDGKKVTISYDALAATEEVKKSIDSLGTDEVLAWTHGRAIKLLTEVDLQFDEDTLEKGNASPDYPGVYSIWPKRTADGWSLVFNQHADIWGTMHDESADTLAVQAVHSVAEDDSSDLDVKLEPAETGATLTLRWGGHQWQARLKNSP